MRLKATINSMITGTSPIGEKIVQKISFLSNHPLNKKVDSDKIL